MAHRLEELNEKRQGQIQRVKVVEKEREGLESKKQEAEDFLDKQAQMLTHKATAALINSAKFRVRGRAPFCGMSQLTLRIGLTYWLGDTTCHVIIMRTPCTSYWSKPCLAILISIHTSVKVSHAYDVHTHAGRAR